MAYDFTLQCLLPAAPKKVFDTWLSSKGHSAMTGGAAKMSKRLGASVSAWDGYITGKNLKLMEGKCIVQSWRTTEFPEDHADSKITITLTPHKNGCKLTLHHEGVPNGQTDYEKSGWQSHYFEPMAAYFSI